MSTKIIFYVFVPSIRWFCSVRPHDSNDPGHAFQVCVVADAREFIFLAVVFLNASNPWPRTCVIGCTKSLIVNIMYVQKPMIIVFIANY